VPFEEPDYPDTLFKLSKKARGVRRQEGFFWCA
jgi:hypothetical protein